MDLNGLYFWEMVLVWLGVASKYTNWTLSSQNFQQFVADQQHFDVIIVDTCGQDSLIGLSKHFNAPFIALSPYPANKLISDLVGAPIFPSYVPHLFSHYSDHMSFWQRMHNSLIYWFEEIMVTLIHTPNQQKYMERMFPNTENWPSLEEIKRNVSLVLLNTHATYATVRPYTPNMIEVGGMQMKHPIKPLAPTIQHFLDEATSGAIYISLGTNVHLNKLQHHQKEAILNAFTNYPNYRILMKSDEDGAGDVIFPSHKQTEVLVQKWFDQQAILAHKNVRLFVTHGGLLSITGNLHFSLNFQFVVQNYTMLCIL